MSICLFTIIKFFNARQAKAKLTLMSIRKELQILIWPLKVKDFYNLIPGNKKEFFIMKNATHAKIPLESWEEVVAWLDKTYVH